MNPSTVSDVEVPVELKPFEDWTQRKETTWLTTQPPMTTTVPVADESTKLESSKERDPRAAHLALQPCPYELLPSVFRQYFHDYDITRALGLPYLSIAIIDMITDYLCASAPLVGSRDFKFEHYWMAELRPRALEKRLIFQNGGLCKLSFPFEPLALTPKEPVATEFSRYHDLTAIGERDEGGEGRGELIDLGDFQPLQRRLWSIFASKSRDEIRLEDYRTMSEAELDGSLSGSAVEVLDEWGRRREILESHWTFLDSPVGCLFDSKTQITISASLDRSPLSTSTEISSAPAITHPVEDTLYAPTIRSYFTHHMTSTPYTTITSDGSISAYSFQLNVIEENVNKEKARVCYFGFSNNSFGIGGNGKLVTSFDATSGSYKIPDPLPLVEMKHDMNANEWIVSTVPNETTGSTRILTRVSSTTSPIFTCQYEKPPFDVQLVNENEGQIHFHWLINGTLMHESVNATAWSTMTTPTMLLTSRLHIKLKHQPGPNPPFRLDHLPTSFDEAARLGGSVKSDPFNLAPLGNPLALITPTAITSTTTTTTPGGAGIGGFDFSFASNRFVFDHNNAPNPFANGIAATSTPTTTTTTTTGSTTTATTTTTPVEGGKATGGGDTGPFNFSFISPSSTSPAQPPTNSNPFNFSFLSASLAGAGATPSPQSTQEVTHRNAIGSANESSSSAAATGTVTGGTALPSTATTSTTGTGGFSFSVGSNVYPLPPGHRPIEAISREQARS